MAKSKEEVRVSIVLLGLALGLTALLFWRNTRQTDGFQSTFPTSQNPVVTANGYITSTSLKTLTENMGPGGGGPTLQIVDPSINTEVWKTGMSKSDSTEVKGYVIISSNAAQISLPKAPNDPAQTQFEAGKTGPGPILEFIRKVSDNSYVNALDGTDVIQFIGIRYKVDTAVVYPSLNTIKSDDTAFPWNIILDATNTATPKWIKGQTLQLTPEGVKELIYLSDKKSYMNLKDLKTLIDSAANTAAENPQKMVYPVIKIGDNYVDAMTNRITYAPQTFLTRNRMFLNYAGIGTAIVATVALIVVGIRIAMRKSDTPTTAAPLVTSAPTKPNTRAPNNKKPNNNPGPPVL